ncbi:MAG: glutathione S-transferase family protein [Pseudomonadales bacterium]|nr:glutathione S-transferase family protein [Pseudomonadales bacterium]
MKFYNSMGPNPQVVRMFAAERGITLDKVEIDLMGGENRKPEYLKKNPTGQSPCLELDDGTVISEVTAICEYLDETAPGDRLLGSTPVARATDRMWTRRVDLGICEPLANGFRFSQGLELFRDRILCRPEAADGLKAMAQDRLKWLDGQLQGKQFILGGKLGLADILLFCFLGFGANVGQPLNPENKNITAWFERMKSRPSAKA